MGGCVQELGVTEYRTPHVFLTQAVFILPEWFADTGFRKIAVSAWAFKTNAKGGRQSFPAIQVPLSGLTSRIKKTASACRAMAVRKTTLYKPAMSMVFSSNGAPAVGRM